MWVFRIGDDERVVSVSPIAEEDDDNGGEDGGPEDGPEDGTEDGGSGDMGTGDGAPGG